MRPLSEEELYVFPTLVGVFLKRVGLRSISKKSSPRSWGCFICASVIVWMVSVFPTLVGVFLGRATKKDWFTRLPHARGGVSILVG